MPSTTDSTAGSTLSEVDTLMERIQAGQEAQKNHNDVTVSAMQAITNAISNINNASKVDKGFERLKLKLLLEQKYTNFRQFQNHKRKNHYPLGSKLL